MQRDYLNLLYLLNADQNYEQNSTAIFLLCKYFKPATTSLAHVGKSLRRRQSQTRRLRNGQKSKQEYSIIIEYGSSQNLRNRIMFLWPFVRFNSAASFTKRDFESMDSTLFFLVTTFLVFLSIFSIGIWTQTCRNPTLTTQTLPTLDPFLPFFSDLLGF